MRIRYIVEEDLPAILRMAHDEGWKSDFSEFQMFIEFNPFGCFVCVDGDKVIGCVMTFCHDKSAWIGNFIVSMKYRGKGIGSKLLSRAIEYLDNKKKKQIYLNAAYKAKGLYEKFGFKDVISVNRWQGEAAEFVNNVEDSQEIIPDIFSFIELDTSLWKDERFYLISQISSLRHVQSHSCPFGFLMYGKVDNVTTIGPWELKGGKEDISERLFVSALSNLCSGSKVLLDVPSTNEEAEELLSKYGFKIVGATMFMCRGRLPKIHFNEIFSFATMGSMG